MSENFGHSLDSVQAVIHDLTQKSNRRLIVLVVFASGHYYFAYFAYLFQLRVLKDVQEYVFKVAFFFFSEIT